MIFKNIFNKNNNKKIIERIENLREQLFLLQLIKIDNNFVCEVTDNEGFFGYKLNTKYGERFLFISLKINALHLLNLHYCEIKDTNAIDFYKKYNRLFHITIVNLKYVIFNPLPCELTPKEVDLAILEFENAISKSYNKAMAMKKNYENI